MTSQAVSNNPNQPLPQESPLDREPRSLREWLGREMWPDSPPADLRELPPELLGAAPTEFWGELEKLGK